MRWHTDRTRENRNTGATIPYQVPRNTATLKVSPTKELALRKRKSQRHLTYGSNSIPLKSSSMSKCTYEIQLERRSRDGRWTIKLHHIFVKCRAQIEMIVLVPEVMHSSVSLQHPCARSGLALQISVWNLSGQPSMWAFRLQRHSPTVLPTPLTPQLQC